ncbi:MAG TPA: LuxR C-terminal-related transcriptional regulator [Candidatus Binatia bacterium]
MTACNKSPAILTRQERRVLELVSEGKTNKEIALVLAISPATVKRHLENILRKLQLKNRVEAAVYAVRLICQPPGAVE